MPTLHVHRMDRLARSLYDLRRLVKDLIAKGVCVQFHKEGQVFAGEDSPMSNLMLLMLGVVAEFERALIRARQREGIAIAMATGVYKGRRPSLNLEQRATLQMRAATGESKAALAREFGIGRQTLYDYLRLDQAKGS